MEIAGQTKTMKKKKKNHTREGQFRHALDTCSRNNDLPGALALYQTAVSENIHITAYHFNTLLHVCSNSLGTLEARAKQSAIETSFLIFDRMIASGTTPTEATITSMARIVAQRSDGGGDLAFDLVRTMGERYGASPKLRTYGPALFYFCRGLDADKVYAVEEHMVSMRIELEETEIAALLEVSVKVEREEKVYEYLQKLRSCVGCVAASTMEIIEDWFRSEQASKVGNLNWDVGRVKDAILRNGGGWHGMGWLGKGKWEVRRANIGSDGCCGCCGERLASVDIDRIETEKFADSVASLAMERKVMSNFTNFQEWLDNHTDFEAIIDGANVGFYQQNFADGGFSLSQLDTVVRELLERSQNKWPLVILHNKRVRMLMENHSNRQLLETWRAEGALYTTPNGSNDDWYWLYAAVKLKCLLVTNDEMRDHIFELLGRKFFPMWKERHQVRYTFVKGDLMLEIPPPYSLVIQELETGSWHLPLAEKCNDERPRTWLCITRPGSCKDSNETDPTAHSTQQSADPHNIHTFKAENTNGMQKLSSPFQVANDKMASTTGKRKDRSSSP